MARVLLEIGLRPAGGNYKTIKRRIKELALDTSHFRGQAWNKGIPSKIPKRPLEEILVLGSTYQTSRLRKRLIEAGLKAARCEVCNGSDWMGRAIPLEVDHLNGNNTDNRLENLRLLCPNCHAQTATYRGKNKRKCAS